MKKVPFGSGDKLLHFHLPFGKETLARMELSPAMDKMWAVGVRQFLETLDQFQDPHESRVTPLS